MAAPTPTTQNATNDSYPEEVLLCPVCQRGFTNPKMLPCLHTFCQQCLADSLQRSNIGNGQGFLCPICRYECQVPKRGVPALPHNVFYETLQDYLSRKGADEAAGISKKGKQCEACESGARAEKKCIECDDWMCAGCCDLHAKVKVTRSHHLVTTGDLSSGGYDELIKDSFESLICGKHEEPLKLYCTELSCLTPICTVCKTTLGHDGHRAIELSDQARTDMHFIRTLLTKTQENINAVHMKIGNIKQEDKITTNVRKKMHKEINTRLEEVLEKIVKQISRYAESLHEEVEKMAKEHKTELDNELETTQFKVKAMVSAQNCAASLLNFGRPEEVVAMGRPVCRRLEDFQNPVNTDAPGWRHPRLHPPDDLEPENAAALFGKLTFEGEVIRCVLMKTFHAKIDGDTQECALSDINITEDNDIIVVDRDNKKVKVFDSEGALLFATDENQFKSPNRVTILRSTGNGLIKDAKSLKILAPNGDILGVFATNLKHPVATCQDNEGKIFVTDWVTGQVHWFNETGQEVGSFESNMEAPAYITANRNNQLIISDWKKHEVRGFTTTGKFMYRYGGEGNGVGQLNHPYGLCTDVYGHVLVADNWNHRVHMLAEDGRFIRFLLTKDDGLKWPQALAVDKTGRLLVAELQGNVKMYQYLA